MIDLNLLKKQAAEARNGLKKNAFNPVTQEAQAAAMGGGAPPMDPMAAMGGMPPGGDPMAAMGGDPMAAMGGGGMPMDPVAMGGDPMAAMGGDPMAAMAMGGGMPPEPGMEEMEAAAGTPVQLNLEDLQQILQEVSGGKEKEESGRATNKDIMAKMQAVDDRLSALAAAMGVQLPAGDVGMGGDTEPTPAQAEPSEIDNAAAALAADQLSGAPGFSEMDAGLPPGETLPKTASVIDWSKTKLAR